MSHDLTLINRTTGAQSPGILVPGKLCGTCPIERFAYPMPGFVIRRLIPLPPYSPELNAIEHHWHYPRRRRWINRLYGAYDELREAAGDGWPSSCLDPERIRTVCRVDYLDTGKAKM
jgi:hypothetical protein